MVQSSKHSPPLRLPRPSTAFFKGSIAGAPGSSVLLSVQPNGAVHGVAQRGNASFILARSPAATAGSGPVAAAAALAAAPLASKKTTAAQMAALPRFDCGAKRKPVPAGLPRAAATPSGSRRLKQVRMGWLGQGLPPHVWYEGMACSGELGWTHAEEVWECNCVWLSIRLPPARLSIGLVEANVAN